MHKISASVLAIWLFSRSALAQASSRVMSLSLQGQLPPLTLPADCLTTSVYDAETEVQGISDNVYFTSSTLVQGCMTDNPRSTCCPNYESAGSYNVYYSPGVCPEGYTTMPDLNIIVQAYSYSEFDEIKLGLKTGKACCPSISGSVTYELYSYGASCLYSESTSFTTSDEVGPKTISTSKYYSASAYIIVPGTDFTTSFAPAPTSPSDSSDPDGTSAEPGQTITSGAGPTGTHKSTGSNTPHNTAGSNAPSGTGEPEEEKKGGMSTGVIAGISAGGAAVLGALIYGAFLLGRKGRGKGNGNDGDVPPAPRPGSRVFGNTPHGMGFSELHGAENIRLEKMGTPIVPGVAEVGGNDVKGHYAPPYAQAQEMPVVAPMRYPHPPPNAYSELPASNRYQEAPSHYQELPGSRF